MQQSTILVPSGTLMWLNEWRLNVEDSERFRLLAQLQDRCHDGRFSEALATTTRSAVLRESWRITNSRPKVLA